MGAAGKGYIKMMEPQIIYEAHVYEFDNSFDSPLYWTARKGSLAAVIVLCRSGSTTFVKNMSCRTPLKEAHRYGHPEIVLQLFCLHNIEELELISKMNLHLLLMILWWVAFIYCINLPHYA